MRPMRGAEGLPHVDGGGSEGGPPPSVFPCPLPDMLSTLSQSLRTRVPLSAVSEGTVYSHWQSGAFEGGKMGKYTRC